MKRFTAVGLALVAVLFAGSPAQAQTQIAFDNLGPSSLFDPVYRNPVQGSTSTATPGLSGLVLQGTPFVPTVSGAISFVELPLQQIGAGGGRLNVYLVPSVSSGLPADYGTQFSQFTLMGTVISSLSDMVYGLTATVQPFISAGYTYWIVLEPTTGNTAVDWNLATSAVTSTDASASWLTDFAPVNAWSANLPPPPGYLGTASGLRVTVVPEPGTLGVGAVLLGFVAIRLTRRQRAPR